MTGDGDPPGGSRAAADGRGRPGGDAGRGHGSRPGVFLGCFLASVGANAYFIAPASVIPLLVSAFGIDKPAAGLAISAAVLGSVLVQLPGGLLMDRYDNRRVLTAGTAAFLPFAAVGAVAPTYPLFLLSRALAGLTAGLVFVLCTNVVSQVFAGHRQGFVTTVFIASAPLGFAVGQVSGPLLAGAFGWAAPFVVFPALSAVGYLLFRLARPAAIRTGEAISLREFGRALGNRSVLAVSFAGFCSYMLYIFMNSWMPTYATERLPLTLGEAGAVAALLPAVGTAARPVGGWLSDRVGYRRRAVTAGSLLFALPGFLVVTRAISTPLFAGVMLGVGFSLQFGMGVYYVYVRELASSGAAGTSLAVFTSVSFTGTLLSPALGGWLIEAFSWGTAFLVYVGVGVVGIATLLATADSRPAEVGG